MVNCFAFGQRKQKMLDQVENSQYFIKGAFEEYHIGRDSDGFHDRPFALEERPS